MGPRDSRHASPPTTSAPTPRIAHAMAASVRTTPLILGQRIVPSTAREVSGVSEDSSPPGGWMRGRSRTPARTDSEPVALGAG